jgi:hypothetical protein
MLALTEIKEDCAWEATMPHPYRWLIQGLTWPLAIPLGPKTRMSWLLEERGLRAGRLEAAGVNGRGDSERQDQAHL